MTLRVIAPDWDAPAQVRAFTTTRTGGVSEPPFDSLNLAGHVDDNESAVEENRNLVRRHLGLPADPAWLQQVHGVNVVAADSYSVSQGADGSYTEKTGVVCAVLTADCLPLFMCSADGTRVGLFHIGWRGLAQGLAGLAAGMFARQKKPMAWLGPAIGRDAFEIGEEVKLEIERVLGPAEHCFRPAGHEGKWFADLYGLVAEQLRVHDVMCGYDDSLCTYTDQERFFSYRRSARCGRMASVIWIDQ